MLYGWRVLAAVVFAAWRDTPWIVSWRKRRAVARHYRHEHHSLQPKATK